ncbi:MAG: phosphodiester glycosidase family protein [Clostridia bacterium]|nr:phosphodiester glycosidase family protein [Clostridia bacterium]
MRFIKAGLIALMLMLLCGLTAMGEKTPSLPVDLTPGKPVQQKNYISDHEYKDPTLHVVIEEGRKDNCDYWIARIKIGHPSQLRTAPAASFDNYFESNGVYIAKRQNAVLAIDGDYYAHYKYGYILRQGKVYRDKLRAERDVLAIDENGDFHILFTPDRNTMNGTLNGKKLINAFHFGPALVVDGEIGALDASYWLAPELKRQRMCIAQTGPLEYFALCCASSRRGSDGMDLLQFAQLAKEMGAVTAYNLDGGDSTIMVFNGEKINDKGNKNTRDISDIIYFASAWDGK